MRKMIPLFLLAILLVTPVHAAELTAPPVPDSGAELMPDTESFGEGLFQMLQKALTFLRPDLAEGARVCLGVMAAVLMVSMIQSASEQIKAVSGLAGSVTLSALLLLSANSMISLGVQTIVELSEYGKLLIPVMTAALAAQGGVSASAALYTGTALFDSVLSSLISRLLVPMVYLFLALACANSAVGEEALKKMRDLVKNAVSWCLKTLLTGFTTYMGITGVISGTTDAAALKAAKAAISTCVPVVGGILSNASETVLVGASLAKNAAGIYGIFAILAVSLVPFLRIWVHYLLLKLTAAVCGIFGTKEMTDLIGDFSTAMGLLLAMTGSVCLLLIISTVCFLKGAG